MLDEKRRLNMAYDVVCFSKNGLRCGMFFIFILDLSF